MASPIGGQFAAIPVFNQLVPNEGPKQITLNLDFSVADIYTFDLQLEIAQKIIWGVQSIYYSNDAGVDVQLVIETTDQVMTLKNNFEGYRPVLMANPPKGSFRAAAGSGILQVKLLNVPMPFGEWAK